ncbi:MAG: heterodisulfide reductase, subunit B, partial [Deltaproteobacteria bacterium]|nr:heterodisulfide reductase, subunit B [Deltaproteobacteria bacterium]
LSEKVTNPLNGLKIAPYYGCTLQRPREVGIEATGSFELMNKFIEALGGEAVRHTGADVCCGSYQVLGNPDAAKTTASSIINGALKAGAEALSMSCPLCEFNLGKKQDALVQENRVTGKIPTFYFTQLLALAVGLDSEACLLGLNDKISAELLKGKGLIK